MSELSIVHTGQSKISVFFMTDPRMILWAVHPNWQQSGQKKVAHRWMWPTEDFTQKELQHKGRKTSTPLHSREPFEQFDSHSSRGKVGQPRMPLYASKWRRAHNASYWPDHKLAQDNGRVFWQNISVAIHTELRHTCRLLCQCGPKESERCRRRNSVPKRDARTKRSAASRIESITLSTGRPVADHSSG